MITPPEVYRHGRQIDGQIVDLQGHRGYYPRLQSLAAANQVCLLPSPPGVVRIDPPDIRPRIRIDDWRRACAKLVPAVEHALAENGDRIADMFVSATTMPFAPGSS